MPFQLETPFLVLPATSPDSVDTVCACAAADIANAAAATRKPVPSVIFPLSPRKGTRPYNIDLVERHACIRKQSHSRKYRAAEPLAAGKVFVPYV
jgi:hypothetical protein